MDSSVLAITTALVFDSILFVILFCVFLFYRKLRNPVIHLDVDIELRKPYMPEGEYSLWELLKKVNRMSLEEVHLAIGEWGFIYLTLHKYIIWTLSVLCLSGCSILLIVYACGDTEVEDTFHAVGISHILEQPDYLAAPVFFLVAFAIVLYVFASYYYSAATNSENDLITPPQRFAMLISKIPRHFPPSFLNDTIQKMLTYKYGSGIISVYTIPQYEHAYSFQLELEEYQEKLKFYQHELNEKGIESTIWTSELKRVNAIDYCETQIIALKEKVQKAKEEATYLNSGHAYVACKTQSLAKEIITFRVERDDVLSTELWKFKPASNPADINWKNIGHTKSFSLVSKIFFNAVFIGLFLILLTPTSFNTLIIDFFEEIGAAEIVEGVIGVYLPSLLLLIYQQVILPEAVDFLVEREKHSYRHDEISSGLRKYLFYLVFYIFLYPLLGLKFIEFVGIFFDNSTNWEEEFAESINSTGEFFTIFLIHETFVKNGWDLMVTGKYFKAKAKALIAVTDVDRAKAYQAEFFKFDLELAISINVFIIACSFCVVYPLIIFPALSFFSMRVRNI